MKSIGFYNTVLVVFVFACCMLIVINACCNDNRDPLSYNTAYDAEPAQVVNGIIEFESESYTGDIYSGTLYTYDSDTGQTKIDAALNDAEISSYHLAFIEDDFILDFQRCKYVVTTDQDSTPLIMLLLVYEQEATDGELSYGLVRYTLKRGIAESLQKYKVVHGSNPWDYWSNDPGTVSFLDIDSENRRVWAMSFPLTIRSFLNRPQCSPTVDPDAWDWAEWVECTLTESAVGCALASAECVFSPQAWKDCVGDGCRHAALAATISCSVEQFKNWITGE